YYTTAGTTQVFYLDTGTRTEVSRHSSDPKYFLADAVVSLMSMMIYGKASRLLCRHLLYQASTKSFLNDRRFYYHLRDGRSWHEIIGSLTAQSCILRVCCTKEVHNHKRYVSEPVIFTCTYHTYQLGMQHKAMSSFGDFVPT
ncbi:hypothetical protein T4B_462, partial [Trichinella pseudospiralis]